MTTSPFGNAGGSAARPHDAGPLVDAFFINDPLPPMCGPDGEPQTGEKPTGTASCPSDKNREGCPCPEVGMRAACWPGKRINREHGQCKDGMTTCNDSPEFGPRWGPCEGYVLPAEDALAGPEACRCFSAGRWNIANLQPCIYRGMSGTYLYSSKPTAAGPGDCGSNVPEPPPVPDAPWSTSVLNVDCAGQFRLCYTIKAGETNQPRPGDCTVMETCVDVWYPEAGVDMKLPDLPAWSSPNKECAALFDTAHGYGEMTVIGHSSECDAVDDGMGKPYVFYRTDYCRPGEDCQNGGSGMFD